MLSLGTGNGPVPAMKDIEVYVPQAVTDIFRVGEHIKAAAHLGEIMLSLVSKVTESNLHNTLENAAHLASLQRKNTAVVYILPVFFHSYSSNKSLQLLNANFRGKWSLIVFRIM